MAFFGKASGAAGRRGLWVSGQLSGQPVRCLHSQLCFVYSLRTLHVWHRMGIIFVIGTAVYEKVPTGLNLIAVDFN